MPWIVVTGIIAIIIFNLSSRHRERMEMIRRGINPDMKSMPATKSRGNKLLLAGLLGGFFGLALSISAVLVQRRFDPDMMTAGLLFLFGGISLIIYWRLTKSQYENKIQETSEYSIKSEKSTGKEACDDNGGFNVQ